MARKERSRVFKEEPSERDRLRIYTAEQVDKLENVSLALLINGFTYFEGRK